VLTATTARDALAILGSTEYPAVIISDMKMPGMDGANFLSQARRIAPNSVRILLTGQANLQSAISAVNDGQLFRFLLKPCPPNILLTAVDAAAHQNRLLTSERVLLEQTLHGCIKSMLDVLALTNPVSFGRASRVKEIVTELGTKMNIGDLWQVEVAAMLHQLGSVSIPQEIMEQAYYNDNLSDEAEQMLAQVPAMTEQLLANIPRMEAVRQIISGSERPPIPNGTTLIDLAKLAIRKKAELLRVAGDFFEVLSQSRHTRHGDHVGRLFRLLLFHAIDRRPRKDAIINRQLKHGSDHAKVLVTAPRSKLEGGQPAHDLRPF
jgi:CheY-like chemotaxis protein